MRGLPCHLSDSPTCTRISVCSPSNFWWVIFWWFIGRLLESICQTNAGDGKQQSHEHAGANEDRGAGPRPSFQHFGGFPAETGKGCESSKKAHGNRHAHFMRNDHAIYGELTNKAKKKAAQQVD